MIHYITVGVALERPPTVQEYRRYAIYGGTHLDAQLVATQMASCTSVMPVEVVRPHEDPYQWCIASGCKKAEVEPHGAMGCRCWPQYEGYADWCDRADDPEYWRIDEHCPLHGSKPDYDGNLRRWEDDVLAGRVGGKVDPCAGRPCRGTGCSHEKAANKLTRLTEEMGLYGDGPAGACGCPCTACYEYCEVPRTPDREDEAPETAASASEAPFAGTDEPTCDHGYCACRGGRGIQLNRETGVLAAIKRPIIRWLRDIWGIG